MNRLTWLAAVLALLSGADGALGGEPASSYGPPLAQAYVERYFETFPTRATAAGRHEFDSRLEDLSPETLGAWVDFNRTIAAQIENALAGTDLGFDDRRDLELVLRRAQRELFDHEVLHLPATYPLYWSGLASNATVMLLVRDDLPLSKRLSAARDRAALLPRLAAQAQAALSASDPGRVAPEIARMAAGQLRASARFYREGFARAGDADPALEATLDAALEAGLEAGLRPSLELTGAAAAAALDKLAASVETLAERATGAPRLGKHYAERFRRVTGLQTPLAEVLARAEAALGEKRAEAAAFGRSVWEDLLPGQEAPAKDRELLAALFDRVARDHAADTDEFLEDYRTLVAESVAFVRERDVMTLPEPLTLIIDRSPPFFVGQSVGGVYAAGPFADADSKTLLFLPTPRPDASAEELEGFFRDFNHHFNVMITPHEIIPGHYLQLKLAARHPRKVRALFGDGVYIEGWGTFCERLMLDLGWGGPLDRLAHLKKQLENIARTIVDIRVHTQGMTRDEVLAFVRDEALQDEQFAANMWRRSITSAPQLTSYFQGYEQVMSLYEEVQRSRGPDFDLKEFLDGMMRMGPIPVRFYREAMLGDAG